MSNYFKDRDFGDIPDSGEFIRTVGENIRKERQRQGLSLLQLQLFCDIDAKNLGDIENGKRNCTLRTIFRIAYGLAVEPEALLRSGQSEDTDPPEVNRKAAAPSPDDGREYDLLVRALGDTCRRLPPYIWERLIDYVKPHLLDRLTLNDLEKEEKAHVKED